MSLEPFDLLRQRFEGSKNPVFAWQCMGLCFELNLEFPDWVLAYLKSSTAAVLRVDKIKKDKKGKKSKNTSPPEAARIGKALGFGRSKGQTGSFDDAYKAVTDEILHKAVQTQLADGEKEYRACEIVAQEHGLSDSTVRRAFLRFAPPK